MKARTVLTLVTTFALPVAVLAQASGKTSATPAAKPAESRLVVMPAGDMKWTDLASDCVFLVESKGPFDLKLVDAGKAPTK